MIDDVVEPVAEVLVAALELVAEPLVAVEPDPLVVVVDELPAAAKVAARDEAIAAAAAEVHGYVLAAA